MWQNCINTVEHTLYLYIIYIFSILWDKKRRLPFGYDQIVCARPFSVQVCECVKVQSSGLTADGGVSTNSQRTYRHKHTGRDEDQTLALESVNWPLL